MHIPADEIKFHPHSFADPAGRLFWWNGDLYRGLCGDSAALFRALLGEGTLGRLWDEGLLIETEATEFSLDGYEMVVRHRVVPFASYPEEWCPAMLKDAAHSLLELLSELAQLGLTLKDCHPWNLLFDRGKPVYVDLTSIEPIRDNQWRSYDEFSRFYQNPLLLMSHGHERIARRLLLEYDGILGREVEALTRSAASLSSLFGVFGRLGKKRPKELRLVSNQRVSTDIESRFSQDSVKNRANSLIARFEETKQQIENIVLPFERCAADREDVLISVPGGSTCAPTQHIVRDILFRLQPSSVLDLGIAENGWYSLMVADSGSMAIAMSTDSALLTRLYARGQARRLSLLPVFMDFTDPTPSRGLASHWSIAASERLKSDMVLALANIHQWVFQRSLTFDQIVEGVATFCKRWLICEFIPPEDDRVRRLSSRKISWYTLENFAGALKKQFSDVSVLSASHGSGVLLSCQK